MTRRLLVAAMALVLFAAPASARRLAAHAVPAAAAACMDNDGKYRCAGAAGWTSFASPAGGIVAEMRARYGALVDSAAWAAGVPADIAHAVVRLESGYNPRLRGRAGEYGIGQIMCRTARTVGFTGACAELYDPQVNLTYAMRYLRQALDAGGTGCAGISGYNHGIATRPYCTGYGHRVLTLAGRRG